ncbi:MAG: hypothetical protein EOP54_10135 [Sphingobacteriales bacterium]|nr:MAG: hypothetical protein EOP54_10135 [Sphingobacteriales bacterium]
MKKKIQLTALFLLLLSGISSTLKAQIFTFTNNLHCPVELFIESRNMNCGTSSGPIILNAMSTIIRNIGPNTIGACLIIRQIGGVQAPGNHLWVTLNANFQPCHNVSVGQSGVTNCGAYTVTLTSNSWTIN